MNKYKKRLSVKDFSLSIEISLQKLQTAPLIK